MSKRFYAKARTIADLVAARCKTVVPRLVEEQMTKWADDCRARDPKCRHEVISSRTIYNMLHVKGKYNKSSFIALAAFLGVEPEVLYSDESPDYIVGRAKECLRVLTPGLYFERESKIRTGLTKVETASRLLQAASGMLPVFDHDDVVVLADLACAVADTAWMNERPANARIKMTEDAIAFGEALVCVSRLRNEPDGDRIFSILIQSVPDEGGAGYCNPYARLNKNAAAVARRNYDRAATHSRAVLDSLGRRVKDEDYFDLLVGQTQCALRVELQSGGVKGAERFQQLEQIEKDVKDPSRRASILLSKGLYYSHSSSKQYPNRYKPARARDCFEEAYHLLRGLYDEEPHHRTGAALHLLMQTDINSRKDARLLNELEEICFQTCVDYTEFARYSDIRSHLAKHRKR